MYENPEAEKENQKAIMEIKSRQVICPKCQMPITEISSAMTDKITGKPMHFDCVLNQLKENERVGENEKTSGGSRIYIPVREAGRQAPYQSLLSPRKCRKRTA